MSRSKSRNRAGTQIVVDRVVELKGRNSLFSTIYQQQNLQSSFATKFAQKYSLVIDGPREISKDGEILIAKITKDGVMQSFGEFLDGANFSWKIGNDEEPKTGNSIIVYADDIKESPMLITCTWKYNYTSASNQTGIMGSGTAGLTTTIQVTWAEIVQYVWTNETDASKVALIPDGAWKDEYGNEPGGDYEYYLWRRVSKDNGETWSYFRESGLNGVGLKSITREFAKNTSSTTAPTEGWGTTYPERDSDEFIWIRDKITLTDNSVTYTTPYLATASNGWSNVRLTLYRRSETEPAPFDGGVLQYTYATNTITGDLGSWSKDPPNGTDPVWAIYATAFSNDEADTISPSEWTVPARLSVEGTQGAKGESVVTLFLFQQSDTRPAVPTGNVTYNIKTHAVTGAGAWSKEVPEGSAKVWVTMATAYTSTDSVTILPSAWASPEIFREKGDSGEDAKLLDVTSDLQAFRFDKDGEPYPNQVATITVRKQGIGADTEFSASNGMKIADNSTEFKVTPYSAGLARVKLTNSADKPWSNNNSHYTFNPSWSGSNRSYDNDTLKLTNVIADNNNLVDIINRVYTIPEFESIQNAGSFIVKLKISNLKITTEKESIILQLFFNRRYKKTNGSIGFWQINKNISTIADKSYTVYYDKSALRKEIPSDFIEWRDDFVTFYIRLLVNSGDTVSLELKDLMLIQPSVCLEDAFPYFADLSNTEKQEVLDTIPYFEDEFELCQTLENRSNPDKGIGTTRYYDKPDSIDYDSDTFTITFNYNNDPSITTPQYVFLGQDNLTHYPEDSGVVFYDRCEIDFTSSSAVSETTQLNRIFGNEVWTHLSGNTPSEINVPIKQYENGFHKRSFLGFTSSTNGTPVFSYLKANQLPELDGSSLRLKNIVLINLTMLGWYVYFKFIGASDNEIYQWCENLPVFKDTHQPSIDTFQLTAVAGDYTDSVILSKVQDGADGEKGDKGDKGDAGTPGQDGADAQLLLLSSDVPAFRLKADRTPYPDQIATVKVTKQGISQTTEFVASNGMAIEDNASEIKVTPYMLGAKFVVKNLVPSNAIYAHNTRKGPNTTVNYIDTLQYDVLNFYENGYRGRKIYIRCTYWANRNKEEGEDIGTFSFLPGNLIPVFDAPEISTTKNTVSKVYTIPIESQGVTNRIGYYIGSTTYTPTSILKDIETYRDDTMLIDVNELEEAFPYFAGLSDAEKKEILDTLPFFEDEFVLGDTLTNYKGVLPTPSAPIYETFNCKYIDAEPRYRYERTDERYQTGYEWSRIDIDWSDSPTKVPGCNYGRLDIFENQTGCTLSFDDGIRTYKPAGEIGTMSAFREQGNTFSSSYIFCIYYGTGQQNTAPNGIIGVDRNSILLLNLTESGWHTYFKLLGFSMQNIKDWADSLPFFEDTYDVPISPLTITATAGDFSDSLSIGVIQDSEAVNFSIGASPDIYNMTSREYVKNEQIIRLDCVKTNYTADHQAVWTLSSTTGLAFSDESGATEYSGTTRQADTVWVKVKVGCLLTSFKVTCSLEGLGERERTISASIPNFKPEYIQVVKAYEEVWSFPTSTVDGPVKAGDMIIYVTKNSDGVKQSTYRKFKGGDPSTASNWVSAVMTNSENSQLMIDGLYDALMEEASNASVLDMVKQLVAQYIAAQFINITGAIFGGERYELQNDAVVDHGVGVGFYLGKDGILKAYGAELINVTAENGTFTGKFKASGFETIDELPQISSQNIEEEYRAYWNNADTYIRDTLVENKIHSYEVPSGYSVAGIGAYKNYILVAIFNGNGSKIMQSTDGGYSFSELESFSETQPLFFVTDDGYCVVGEGKKIHSFSLAVPNLQAHTVIDVTTIGSYIKKINDTYFLINYYLKFGDIYYSDDYYFSSSSKISVSIDDIAYYNGKWIGVRLNSSLNTYIGTSLTSMQSKPVSIPELPDIMDQLGIAVSDDGILCILLSKDTVSGHGNGIYILRCDNLSASTLEFTLITISDNDDNYSENIVYDNGIFILRGGAGKIYWSVNGSTWNTSSTTFDMGNYTVISENTPSVFSSFGWILQGSKKVYILPQINNTKFTSFFLDVKSKLLSTVTKPTVEPLSYTHDISATFTDITGTSHNITSLKALPSGVIEFTTSDGEKYRFGETQLYPITIKNLVISAEQASINITSMNPMNDKTDIGRDGQRVRNVYANNLSGNVNSEGTTYKVWGAVAN